MNIQAPCLDPLDGFLMSLPLQVGNVPTQAYDQRTLNAFDNSGALPMEIRDVASPLLQFKANTRIVCHNQNITVNDDQEKERQWHVLRPTNGDVVVQFSAFPRHVDMKTPVGPRVDLREDQGGLQGAGITFIPIPGVRRGHSSMAQSEEEEPEYIITVEWDLNHSPKGTRAVWTFGEGSNVVKVGRLDSLRDSVYMVGPISSNITATADRSTFVTNGFSHIGEAAELDTAKGYFGFYWFGSVPPKISNLVSKTKGMFEKMSAMFGDPPSKENPYRIFIRRSMPARGFGGSAFQRSYVLEYDTYIDEVSEAELLFLLVHEMVHNWLLMDNETNSPGGDDNAWYIEGISLQNLGPVIARGRTRSYADY